MKKSKKKQCSFRSSRCFQQHFFFTRPDIQSGSHCFLRQGTSLFLRNNCLGTRNVHAVQPAPSNLLVDVLLPDGFPSALPTRQARAPAAGRRNASLGFQFQEAIRVCGTEWAVFCRSGEEAGEGSAEADC